MVFTLNLTFTRKSGKKQTIRITGAKSVQEPTDVKALMDHLVANNLLNGKDDPIVSVFGAKLQGTNESVINL